jgi:hypothetical protein
MVPSSAARIVERLLIVHLLIQVSDRSARAMRATIGPSPLTLVKKQKLMLPFGGI